MHRLPLVVLALLTSGTLVAAQSARDKSDSVLLARADLARIQGAPTAPVWLVEVSDFQCPFCKRWHEETYPVIKREFITPGLVRLAYVNYPVSGHANALPAAEAAMCAALQDRFWPMHDALFATQDKWAPRPDAPRFFDSLAVAQGIDGPKLRQCVSSGVMRKLVAADQSRWRAAGVGRTPTFFVIGDTVIEGAHPTAVFRAALARAVAKAAPAARP